MDFISNNLGDSEQCSQRVMQNDVSMGDKNPLVIQEEIKEQTGAISIDKINTFAEIVSRLKNFWIARGCVMLEPYDLEMGAATSHPDTILHALSDDDYRIAFMQKCRRPQDSRSGKSGNRLYRHTQFQVLIAPPPDSIQHLAELSLIQCGINPKYSTIQFLEDNWQNPSIGAAGKGYEVRCNGMEVLQFTYFQQMFGEKIQNVPVELAYGLERLVMMIQHKSHVFDLLMDIVDGREISYGEMYGRFEKESFDAAFPPELLYKLFDTYERICLDLSGSFTPCYETFLKMSHTFNLIESAGSIDVSSRVTMMDRLRKASRACYEKTLKRKVKAIEQDSVINVEDEVAAELLVEAHDMDEAVPEIEADWLGDIETADLLIEDSQFAERQEDE